MGQKFGTTVTKLQILKELKMRYSIVLFSNFVYIQKWFKPKKYLIILQIVKYWGVGNFRIIEYE